MKQAGITAASVVLLLLVGATFVLAGQQENIDKFNLSSQPVVERASEAGPERPTTGGPATSARRSVGSVLSPNAGIGKGYSVDLTYDDSFYHSGRGRHVQHWWNGEFGGSAEVHVHFGTRHDDDPDSTSYNALSSHHIYEANDGGDWPLLWEVGCWPQATSVDGWGNLPSLAVTESGLAVMAASSFWTLEYPLTTPRYFDNMLFYQDIKFGCYYDPSDGTFGNVTRIDSTTYRPLQLNPVEGKYTQDPQVATQWDGSNTIVHLILAEPRPGLTLTGNDYANTEYATALYFRKVGDEFDAGSWSTGQIIDSCWFPWFSLAAAPYPNQQVAVSYTNPSYYGALLNEPNDLDVWYRESLDLGLTWQPATSATLYTNAIAGDMDGHFIAWLESQCLYSTDGDLHIVWTGKKTSPDPYFDGFNWNDFDANVYHWSRSSGMQTEVANGTFKMWDDWLLGSFNTLHCGFGGSNAGYTANVNISECDGKLYCVWNQIHERANRFPWRDASTQPAPGVLDDCAYTGNRLAMANWEILMSVKSLAGGGWDAPRNISNTYTPDCGPPGDPEGAMLCGSEYKPSVEKYSLDESGLGGTLTWPVETEVDLSPGQDYSGTAYLNMSYMDDQFPGPNAWGRTTEYRTNNSVKWVRLACVEPVYAAYIEVAEGALQWPEWVDAGQLNYIQMLVTNMGNVQLEITDISFTEHGPITGWLSSSESPTPADPLTIGYAGQPGNVRAAEIIIDATTITEPTWLDGTITISSNAADHPTLDIDVHLLAADHVEPVVWDTVMSHEHMFSPWFYPEGECVALAVGNNGEMGLSEMGGGAVNLDYVESELECGERAADGFYLAAGSAFVIMADDDQGTNARLTQSAYAVSHADPTAWVPTNAKGSITGGQNLAADLPYDSAYTGQFVNRDTTIAMERTYYAPRSNDPVNEMINYVVVHTRVYSADGNPHEHITVGDVIDWDVPSDSISKNEVSLFEDFMYVAGTNDDPSYACQDNTHRLAAQAFGGAMVTNSHEFDACFAHDPNSYYGMNALPQHLMTDTTHDRDGNPLFPYQPIPGVWWDETSVLGLNDIVPDQNLATWMTVEQDFSLGADEVLHYWTVLTTVRDGELIDLQEQVNSARCSFPQMLGCDVPQACQGCCEGTVGDANWSDYGLPEPLPLPTIGDVAILIDAKFIHWAEPCSQIACLAEADINQSGGCDPTCDDITIGDISMLIDYLFITGPDSYGPLPPCLDCW